MGLPDLGACSKAELRSLIIQAAALLAVEETPTLPAVERPDVALTVEEACAQIGISPSTFYAKKHEEPFRALLIATGTRKVRISRKRLEAYLASPPKPVAPAPAPRRGTPQDTPRFLRGAAL